MVTGRQMLFVIMQHYRMTEAGGAIFEMGDLLTVRLHNDNIRSFVHDWERVITCMKVEPEEYVLEGLLLRQLRNSTSFRDHITYYDRLQVGHPDRTFKFLMRALRSHLDLVQRTRMREQMQTSLLGKGAKSTSKGQR